MDKILILLLVVLGTALVVFFVIFPEKESEYHNMNLKEVKIYIGSVPVIHINASERFVVDFKDEAIAPRLEELYREGKLLVFQAQEIAGSILVTGKAYSKSEEKAREELSRFLSTVIKVATGKVLDCSANLQACRSVYVSVSRTVSESVQFGAKVILKYRDFEFGVGWRCGVVLFYDPTLVLDSIRMNSEIVDILRSHGIDPEEFLRKIDETIEEENKKGT